MPYNRERNQNWFLLKFREARKSGGMLNRKKLIADYCLQMLSSERTALEFLKMFENAGMIKQSNGRIEVLK